MTATLSDLSPAKLRQAARLKEQIEKSNRQLAKIFKTNGHALGGGTRHFVKPKRKKMSASARRKISVAMKARWASK